MAKTEDVQQQKVELEATIAGLTGEIARLEVEHGTADTLAVAEPLEQRLAIAQGKLRRARGELLLTDQALARLREAAKDAAQEPHRRALRDLAQRTLPERVEAYRVALASLAAAGRSVVQALHDIGNEAEQAGHSRAAELAHPSAEDFASGAAGRVELAYAVFGEIFRLCPAYVAQNRMMTINALGRLTVSVQNLVKGI